MASGIEEFGAVVTGGLAAREIDRGGAADTHHIAGSDCANCGTALIGAHCHACGQRAHVHRDLKGLFHDIAHGVFHVEGRTWHTLPMLATKPGQLTRRYVQGERAKFVSPMALFLFSVFLMFAVVSSFTEHAVENIPERLQAGSSAIGKQEDKLGGELVRQEAERAATKDDATRRRLDAEIAETRRSLATLRSVQNGIAPAKAEARGSKEGIDTGLAWLDRSIEHASKNPQLLLYKIKTSAYKYSWALIPISLPFIWLLFAFRRDVGLYDHAIFATYSLAFMSMLVVVLVSLSLAGVKPEPLWSAFVIVPPIHMYKQLKYAYRLGRWGAGWRTFALLNMTGITGGIFITLLLWMGTAF